MILENFEVKKFPKIFDFLEFENFSKINFSKDFSKKIEIFENFPKSEKIENSKKHIWPKTVTWSLRTESLGCSPVVLVFLLQDFQSLFCFE